MCVCLALYLTPEATVSLRGEMTFTMASINTEKVGSTMKSMKPGERRDVGEKDSWGGDRETERRERGRGNEKDRSERGGYN